MCHVCRNLVTTVWLMFSKDDGYQGVCLHCCIQERSEGEQAVSSLVRANSQLVISGKYFDVGFC